METLYWTNPERTSDPSPEVAAALVRAVAEMDMPAFDAHNSHFKQPYATLASFMAACRGVLAKHGFALLQPLHSASDATGTQHLCITTMLVHGSGECLRSTVMMPMKENPQHMGASITYFRRYCVGSVLGLVGEPDDDAEMVVAPTGAPQPTRPEQPARPAVPTPARPAPQPAPQPARPAAPAPQPAPQPAAQASEADLLAMPYPTSMDGDATVLLPKKVTAKTGTTNGRAWERFEYTCTEVLPSGETMTVRVSTFDTKVAARMDAAMGSRVIAVVKEGKGSVLDLVRIVAVEQPGQAKQRQQQAAQEVSDDDIPF